ncbi:MAG: response regulator [Thermomicrobiales bacterium]
MDATETHLAVYLIEDDPDHTLIITRATRQISAEVRVSAIDDGEAALAVLREAEGPPDLILLDINMSGLSGFDVLAQLKADPRLKLVPVVMLTSSDMSSDVARAYELGASGYISKPNHLHDLRAVLGNTLLYWAAMKRATTTTGER